MAARASSGPRVRVAAVIPLGGELVLVRHRGLRSAYHLLPGGGVEPGETLESALVREVEEETGLVVRLDRPLLLSDTLAPDGRRHVVNVSFLAERVGGGIATRPADPRVEAVDLVAFEALGTLDLRPPMAQALLTAFEEGFRGAARYLGPLWVEESSKE